MDDTKTGIQVYQEDDKIQAGIQIIRMLCRREPYLSKGLIYFKEGEQHAFSFYKIPEVPNDKSINTIFIDEPVDPVFTVVGESIQDCLIEIISAIHTDDRQNGERKWRILPFDEKDLGELEQRLDSDVWILHEATGIYFAHRKKPLTKHNPYAKDYTPEMEDLKRKKELAELKASIITRLKKPARILQIEPQTTNIPAP